MAAVSVSTLVASLADTPPAPPPATIAALGAGGADGAAPANAEGGRDDLIAARARLLLSRMSMREKIINGDADTPRLDDAFVTRLLSSIKVKDAIVDCVRVAPDATLDEALAALNADRRGVALVVAADGTLSGLITLPELRAAALAATTAGDSCISKLVSDVHVPAQSLVTISDSAPLDSALGILTLRGLDVLPVVPADSSGRWAANFLSRSGDRSARLAVGLIDVEDVKRCSDVELTRLALQGYACVIDPETGKSLLPGQASKKAVT